jgi:hypothetical protein
MGMTTPNYYDLSGNSSRIGWYPNGRGGPLKRDATPIEVAATQRATLVYSSGPTEVIAGGDQLIVGPPTPAGQFVVVLLKTSGIVPGGITAIGVLIPDVDVETSPVAVETYAVISVHRGVAQLGAGQLETYTEMRLRGTAAKIIFPALAQ